MGTSGVYKFHFTSDSAQASHVAWKHLDYDHTTNAFLLDHTFTHHSKYPQVVELPLPCVTGFTEFYNPIRPSHLVGGALVRHHRSYSPTEIRSMRTIGLEQSPAYFSRRARPVSRTPSRVSSCSRTQSLSQPRSIISVDGTRSRERSRERTSSLLLSRTQKVPPRRRDSGSASCVGDRSRSPSPPRRRYPEPIWKRQVRTMPVKHSKFIWDIVSYISNLQAFFDFALGCGILSHVVCRAIEDNDPSDEDISFDDCAAQALTVWWLSSDKPAIWKSDRIRQGFVKLHMPGIHSCLIKRHPTMDPNPPKLNNQTGPQPGTRGTTLCLKSTEYDFLRELSNLIQTPENACGIACITNLPDATIVFIRQEHTHFGLPVKEIQGRIAFHVLAIWYILAKGVKDKASIMKEMFYDLELDEECADIFDKFPWVTSERDGTGPRNKTNTNNIQMGTKVLGKGQKSKSSTTVGQGNCSSTNHLNPIRENGEIVDMEE